MTPVMYDRHDIATGQQTTRLLRNDRQARRRRRAARSHQLHDNRGGGVRRSPKTPDSDPNRVLAIVEHAAGHVPGVVDAGCACGRPGSGSACRDVVWDNEQVVAAMPVNDVATCCARADAPSA